MVATSTVLFVLMAIIIFLVGRGLTRSIHQEVAARGLAVAHSIAAVSTTALVTYNYVALEQNAEQASRGTDIVYVIILNKEGRVAAYSGHYDRQGEYLNDLINQRALAANIPLSQSILREETGERGLDFAIPVFMTGSEVKWGTVRLGLSLERMYRQIKRTQLALVGIGMVALLLGLAGSHFMAGRITRPLGRVVEATIAAAGGDLDQRLDIRTRDEVEDLARNFNVMIQEILAQKEQLENHLGEILELKRYNDMILTSMTNGLITMDLEGRLVSSNAAAETMLCLGKETWQGKAYLDLWPEESPLGRLLIQCLRDRTVCRNQEIAMDRGDEHQRTFIVNTSLLQNAREVPVGLLVLFNDITELKEMESKIRQGDRLAALGILSAGLAHEIRNPHSAIKTFVQLLPKKISNPTFFDKFQVTVPRELNRINDLIEDLLELARPPRLKFKIISIADMLMQTADLYRDRLEAADIAFELKEQRPLPKLWADGEHLIRAFSNLFMNAMQAMPEGGRMTVTVQALEDGILVQFSDTGVGMDRVTRENIFNPFFTTKDKGTGLGLAITHKIIQEHGGAIEVDSKLGEGSTFTLTLPALQG